MYYGIVYLFFWIVLSENFKVETICIGIIIGLLVRSFNKDWPYSNSPLKLKKNIILWIYYIIIFLKEMLVSNLHVAKIVLSPQIIISPQIVIIKTKIKSDFHKTIFANSTTLTPGTLTISIDEDKIAVHCLCDEFAEDITNSTFEKLILKIEEGIYE
ncbi:MAG: Na+/H+ antiporter subunit E [Clostridium sp.]|uniref:Na+/H+ antiporter subunit E n=1 Tax=Clostridium sp. TaxID=1506 RepID=UPI003D6D71A6